MAPSPGRYPDRGSGFPVSVPALWTVLPLPWAVRRPAANTRQPAATSFRIASWRSSLLFNGCPLCLHKGPAVVVCLFVSIFFSCIISYFAKESSFFFSLRAKRCPSEVPRGSPVRFYLTAAITEISTKMASEAILASTQQRAGSLPGVTQASHTLFIWSNSAISFR